MNNGPKVTRSLTSNPFSRMSTGVNNWPKKLSFYVEDMDHEIETSSKKNFSSKPSVILNST